MWNTYSDPTRKCVCAHVLDSYLLHGGMHGPVGVATLVCMGSCTDQGLWFGGGKTDTATYYLSWNNV